MNLIPINKFQEVFTRLGLKKEKAKSGKYEIWRSEENVEEYTVLPLDIENHDYQFLQVKSIEFIAHLLKLPSTNDVFEEIKSQLENYNYKLINRIILADNENSDSVPFRLADGLTNKNVESFIYYYNKRRENNPLNIKNLQLNHTQKGSFLIPISIMVNEDDVFPEVPTLINSILREYLDVLDFLAKFKVADKEKFALSLLDRNIDSRLAKGFFAASDSVAKYVKDYETNINTLTISGRSNPILDFKLKKEEKIFREIELTDIPIVEDDYIEYLERKEVELNSESIYETNVNIDVIVDAVDRDGRVKLNVLSISGTKAKKSFKAFVDEQPQARLNDFADSFKSGEVIVINGDIRKPKAQAGKILINTVNPKKNQQIRMDIE